MASVTHYYPWVYYDEESQYKYGYHWSSNQALSMNGNNVTYQIMNTTLPSCSELKIELDVTSGYTGVFNRSWDIWIKDTSWREVHTFTMPAYTETGSDEYNEKYEASIELTIPLTTARNITAIAAGPSSRMSSGSYWSLWLGIDGAKITETISDASLSDSDYFCGLQYKRYSSLYTDPKKVEVNIGGNLVTATEVMVNIGGELVALPKMQQYNFVASTKEQAVIIPLTPTRDGTHVIRAYDQYAGSTNESYAYFKVYDSEMNEVMTYYTTSTSLELEAGKQYYLIAIDHPYYSDLAQRVIKVYST